MIIENIKLALASLRVNKLRSILTMLGIIIGIAAIISIIYIGNAMTSSVSDDMSGLGSRNIICAVEKRNNDLSGFIQMEENTEKANPTDLISSQMIEDINYKFADDIEGIALKVSKYQAKVRNDIDEGNITLTGVNPSIMKSQKIDMLQGDFITENDVNMYQDKAVISDLLAKKIFPNMEDIIGKDIKVYSKDDIKVYQIVGVYKYEVNPDIQNILNVDDLSTEVYIPISTAMEESSIKSYNSITVIGKDASIDKLTNKLQQYFDKEYEYNSLYSVRVENMKSVIDMVDKTLKKISLAITSIAAISLIVGGIGVMNIMLVSVTERTREIGTKKALGAKEKHIKMQFVIESMIISFIGGVIGLSIGTLIGYIISILTKSQFKFSLTTWLITIVFAVLIGVSFGYYPAQKAAKLDPIEALRYE